MHRSDGRSKVEEKTPHWVMIAALCLGAFIVGLSGGGSWPEGYSNERAEVWADFHNIEETHKEWVSYTSIIEQEQK